MRTLSIMAFASFLILWGVYSYLHDGAIDPLKQRAELQKLNAFSKTQRGERQGEDLLFSQNKRRDLDKIGQVINEDNVDIDHEERLQIKTAKSVFENNHNLKEKQILLEQSFMDPASDLQDTHRLQNEIVILKKKMKIETTNTENWDPKFIFYLMMQENYTYQEINGIKSLTENGLNPEEVNYINEQISEKTFKDKIKIYKDQGETGRVVASLKSVPKEKDEFIEDHSSNKVSAESKMIEMNYNQEDKEDSLYRNNQ